MTKKTKNIHTPQSLCETPSQLTVGELRKLLKGRPDNMPIGIGALFHHAPCVGAYVLNDEVLYLIEGRE